VDLQTGRATITPAPGARIEPPAIFEVLNHAGFRGDAVTIEATGEVKRIYGRPQFFLPGQPDAYVDLPVAAPADGPALVRVRVTASGEMELR
jgi:hypothetical protein